MYKNNLKRRSTFVVMNDKLRELLLVVLGSWCLVLGWGASRLLQQGLGLGS